jgi:hypothetical protein
VVARSGTGATGATFSLRNIRAYVNVLDVDPTYYAAISQRIATTPLEIPFKRWLSFSAPQLTGSGSVRMSLSTQSLDAAYMMLLPPTPGVVVGATSILSDLSTWYFRRLNTHTTPATGRILTAQFDANSVQYPSWQATPAEWALLALNTFKLHKDTQSTSPYDLDLDQWFDKLSFFSHRFSHGGPTDLSTFSGLDTRGLAVSVVANIVATGSLDGLPLMLAETTASLMVGQFRSVSLIA